MVFQIAEGCGVALLAREEVLIDAQHLGTDQRVILSRLTLEAPQEVALHRSGSDPLASPQAAPVDPIQMVLIDHLLEALAGSLAPLYPRQLLAKTAPTIQAPALPHLQVHHGSSGTPVVVADDPATPSLVS